MHNFLLKQLNIVSKSCEMVEHYAAASDPVRQGILGARGGAAEEASQKPSSCSDKKKG